LAVKTAAYHTLRIEALYTQLEELEASPVNEYQTDNSGQRMGIKYRAIQDILSQIQFHENKIAMINSKGGKVLAVFKRGY
jgi:predicted DNA-binding protein (UPF0251 family)